jgi:predicted enzyme related to lactoylglutathione lyase
MVMGNPVAFFEIVSPDAARARAFYTELFGWTADANPAFGGYALVDTQAGEGAIGAGIGGGIGAADEPGEAGVKIYMRVEDLEACVEKAEKLGGTLVVPPHDLPGDAGRTAIFTDPDGNQVGLWA